MTDSLPSADVLTPARVLDRMADELERHGHARFYLKTGDGSMCIRGAYNLVVHGEATEWQAARDDELELPVAEALELVLGDELASHRLPHSPYDHEAYIRWLPIVDWNNSFDVEGERIITTCREAARRAEELAS